MGFRLLGMAEGPPADPVRLGPIGYGDRPAFAADFRAANFQNPFPTDHIHNPLATSRGSLYTGWAHSEQGRTSHYGNHRQNHDRRDRMPPRRRRHSGRRRAEGDERARSADAG